MQGRKMSSPPAGVGCTAAVVVASFLLLFWLQSACAVEDASCQTLEATQEGLVWWVQRAHAVLYLCCVLMLFFCKQRFLFCLFPTLLLLSHTQTTDTAIDYVDGYILNCC